MIPNPQKCEVIYICPLKRPIDASGLSAQTFFFLLIFVPVVSRCEYQLINELDPLCQHMISEAAQKFLIINGTNGSCSQEILATLVHWNTTGISTSCMTPKAHTRLELKGLKEYKNMYSMQIYSGRWIYVGYWNAFQSLLSQTQPTV